MGTMGARPLPSDLPGARGHWPALSKLQGEGPATAFARKAGLRRRLAQSSRPCPAIEAEMDMFARGGTSSQSAPRRPLKAIDLPDMAVSGAPEAYSALLAAMARGPDRRAALAVVNAHPALGREIAALLGAGAMGREKAALNAREAAALLGPVRLCQLGGLLCLLELWPGRGIPGLSGALFKEHSLAVGALSALLAREMGLDDPEDFFLAGLAHDLGRLVLARNRPQAAADVVAHALATGSTLVEAEFARLGYSHATQGSVILRSWPEPPAKLHAVLYHHIPDLAVRSVDCGVVHLADALAHALALGFSGERFVPRICPWVSETLGLGEAALSRAAAAAVAVADACRAPAQADVPEADQPFFEFF